VWGAVVIVGLAQSSKGLLKKLFRCMIVQNLPVHGVHISRYLVTAPLRSLGKGFSLWEETPDYAVLSLIAATLRRRERMAIIALWNMLLDTVIIYELRAIVYSDSLKSALRV
jgi:hypothetical protein